MLKISVKVVAFALALLLSAAPVMACLAPGATLTVAERACCKRMAKQCGGAAMSKSHSCCQTTTGAEGSTFVKATSAQLDHIVNVTYISPVLGAFVLTGVPPVHALASFRVHGPPGPPPAAISVLRI